MVKFNKYNVTDGTTKVRVSYSLDNNIHHAKCVTLHAKDYGNLLGKLRLFADVKNETDSQQDYFEKDRVVLTPDNPFYAFARARAEQNSREWDAKYAAKYATVTL